MNKKYCKDCKRSRPPQVLFSPKKKHKQSTDPPIKLCLCYQKNIVTPTREDWEACDNFVPKVYEIPELPRKKGEKYAK